MPVMVRLPEPLARMPIPLASKVSEGDLLLLKVVLVIDTAPTPVGSVLMFSPPPKELTTVLFEITELVMLKVPAPVLQ